MNFAYGTLIFTRVSKFQSFLILLQILRASLENKPDHHIVHDPLNRRVVICEDGSRFVARFQIVECHLHRVDQKRVNIWVLRKQHEICRKVFWFGFLPGREDHRIQCAGDVHCVNRGENCSHCSGESIDETSIAGDAGRVDGQDSVLG